MKKELFALALLLLILLTSLGNAIYMDRRARETGELLSHAERAAARDEWETAVRYIEEARRLWGKNSRYLQAVLRHTDLDTVRAEFYEVLRAAAEHNRSGTILALRELQDKLLGIAWLEGVHLGSVF